MKKVSAEEEAGRIGSLIDLDGQTAAISPLSAGESFDRSPALF